MLKGRIRSIQPDFILLLGEKRHGWLTLEMCARNVRTGKNKTRQIHPNGKAIYFTKINTRRLLMKLRAPDKSPKGFWQTSQNAGNYLCNFSYYQTLSQFKEVPALFVHVRALEEKSAGETTRRFSQSIYRLLKTITTLGKTAYIHTKAIDATGANGRQRENKRGLYMADKHLVACEQEHEMVTVLKHFKKGFSKENVDKMQNACRAWKKDATTKYKPKNRDTFYKYLQEKGILSKIG